MSYFSVQIYEKETAQNRFFKKKGRKNFVSINKVRTFASANLHSRFAKRKSKRLVPSSIG